jgi:predicted enzyme related to lactoylglutathione lyase
MANPFVHMELMATDVAKAKSFYGKLFNWQLEDMPMEDMTYTMIKVGEGTGGGMLKNPIPGSPSMWVPYVDVDNLEAATNKARTLGGKVMREATEVKGHGRFTIVTDPNGTMLGLWEQAKG